MIRICSQKERNNNVKESTKRKPKMKEGDWKTEGMMVGWCGEVFKDIGKEKKMGEESQKIEENGES